MPDKIFPSVEIFFSPSKGFSKWQESRNHGGDIPSSTTLEYLEEVV